jgi:menaquinol-cytochrome c reductase iron-sulfur subunit
MACKDHWPRTDRRGFCARVGSVVIGGLAALTPVVSGLLVVLDPLRRKLAGRTVVRVAHLSALPEDGVPRKFPVISSRVDAWTKSSATAIGAVYLRREKGKPVEALNVVCPHAGCFVDYVASLHGYHCPCHNSMFALDGAITDPKSPAPRGLDALEVEIRGEGEVWVKFQNYRAGVAKRVPA